MSDSTRDEAAGLGAADPITGVTAGHDDLDDDTRLPDTGVEDGDEREEADGGEAADFARGDRETVRAESGETVTTDGVAGETVYPGPGDGNDGPTGGNTVETTPVEPDDAVDPGSIDLDDER